MKLYGYRNGRTLRALWALEEAAVEYQYVEVDIIRGEGQQPAFLQTNLAGKVPVLVDDETVITESAAVCMHLADRYPASALMPEPGSMERSQCYRWISFVLTELDAPLWTIAKHRFALPVERRVPAVIETAAWEFDTAAKILAQTLDGRCYLVGGRLTVADVLAGHTLMWARSARLPALGRELEQYLEGLSSRDALRRAREAVAGRGSNKGPGATANR